MSLANCFLSFEVSVFRFQSLRVVFHRMPGAYPPKVRDICIHQYQMGFDAQTIHELTNISVRSIQRWIQRYRRFGTILSASEQFGDNRGRPRTITDDDLVVMCFVWIRDPTLYIDEVAVEMGIILGKYIDPDNLKYWKKKMGITRKKLWKVCVFISLYLLD